MKHVLKVAFVFLVIFGLIASYVFLAPPASNRKSADIEAEFREPTAPPSAKGPTSPPPGQ